MDTYTLGVLAIIPIGALAAVGAAIGSFALGLAAFALLVCCTLWVLGMGAKGA